MNINGRVVSYEFGPQNDLDIRFSASFENQTGISYGRCGSRAKLVFQLLCHAVQQLQSTDEDNWCLDRIEEMDQWEYPTPEPGETLLYVVKNKEPILVTYHMTYSKFQIKVNGRLVFVAREGANCDYLIDYFDCNDDAWLETVFDCAKKHCKRFGRM